MISGLLHGALLLAFGHARGAAGFILLFAILGLVGVGAIRRKSRPTPLTP